MKKVVYTCISGQYDILTDPVFINKEFDYVCFTDQPFYSEVWQIRPIPEELNSLSQVKKQRIVKICPHRYLPEYDLSIWVDGNIIIKGDKNDNQVTNLQWVTPKQNIQHAWQTGLCENTRKASEKPIYSKDLDLKFESLTEVAIYLQSNYFENIKLEFLINYIFKLLNNKVVKSKYDFSWEYVNK